MMNLLVLKEKFEKLYQSTSRYLKPVFKFLLSYLVFYIINQQLGYDPQLKKIPVLLALSVLGAFTPSSILLFMSAAVVIGHVYYISKMLSIFVLLSFFIIYFLFARYTPKMGYIILAVPILSLLKIPYVAPLLLGMTSGPIALIPTGCGVVVYYFIQIIKQTAQTTANSSVEDVLELYKYVMDALIANKEIGLTLFVFSLVIIITYLVRKLKIDYAFYIAIAAGTVTNILGFLIGDLQLNISNQIGYMVLYSLLSAILVAIIEFFRLSLDYTAVEYVQFEDDDYYYYVKAVPKMKVTAPKKDVKRINVQKSTGNTMNLKTDLERANRILDRDEDEYMQDILDTIDQEFDDYDLYNPRRK